MSSVRSSAHIRELSEFLSELRWEDVPEEVRSRACQVVADTLAVTLAGAELELPTALRSTDEATGESVLLAPGLPRTSAQQAAFLNAVAACSAELDEGIRPTGHPAIHVMPVALAQAQALDLAGTDFLLALVVGYEVQARLQRAVRLRSNVHCHGNFGDLGAVAALKRLRGARAGEFASALNGAANFASATSYSLPYAGATVHSGAPAVSGSVAFLVDRLTAVGYTGYDDSVGEVFGEILGTEFDPAPLTERLGDEFMIGQGYVKFHSACGHAHPVLDALVEAFGPASSPWTIAPIDPDEVRRVEVTVSERAGELHRVPDAERDVHSLAMAARFSIPFSTALFLAYGEAGVAAYSAPRITDPRVRALAGRVELRADPQLDALFPDIHRAAVTVEFVDGRRVSGECGNPYGNAMNPAAEQHVRQKFGELVGGSARRDDAAALWDGVMDLASLERIRSFPAAD